MRVQTQKTREGLKLLAAGLAQAAALTVRAAVDAAQSSAKGTTLFKDGTGPGERTRSTIRGEAFGYRGRLTAGGVSKFLEGGTAAHWIVARRAKTLRFMVNGQTFYRRAVFHPGTAPRPFMSEARMRGEIAAEYAAEYFVGHTIRNVR